MKRKHDWRTEAAWYQRLVAVLIHRIGGTVNISPEEIEAAAAIEVAHLNGGVSLRPKVETRTMIVSVN